MADALFEHALLNITPMLVDGSLRDVDYHRSLFKRIRSDFSEFRIAIIHITAYPRTIHERSKKRAERISRAVPKELLDASIVQIPRSVKLLSPHADIVFEISINDGSPLHLVTPGVSWNDFSRKWTEEEEKNKATSSGVFEKSKKTRVMRRKSTIMPPVQQHGLMLD